ncbi:MAG: hypothetical protein VX949_00010 [Planctomycetota bacterium]|nr:hypothetical protein [Planctomycetota bacterium]
MRRKVDHLQQDVEQLLQRLHPELTAPREPTIQDPTTKVYEARGYSQNGEDGVLLHLLAEVGVVGHRIVEIGCGCGAECNSALLSCCFGWNALLFDRNGAQVEKAVQFFQSKGAEDRVRLIHQEVQPDALDRLLETEGFSDELDVLSIDVDGFDFWIWKHLDTVRPRIVVIEVNGSYGPEASGTVPWSPGDPHHDPYQHHARGWHHGASLRALEALGRSKGYRLVAVESTGTNAFFVREDVVTASLPEVDPRQVWHPHQVRSRRHSPDSQARSLAGLPFVEVDDCGEVNMEQQLAGR